MAHEINLGGTIYISARRAAEITGYKQDYIGQLARAGRVVAKRIGGLWYVLEESLLGHKQSADSYVPTPPHLLTVVEEPAQQAESLISFDGQRYVSAVEASRMTSYHQDYIGQLARSGKILSKQIGNRWFVEAEGLQAHKAEKDRLLQSVQVESVGLRRSASSKELTEAQNIASVLHFSYTLDSGDLLPQVGKEIGVAKNQMRIEEVQHIPIKIIHTQHRAVAIPKRREKIVSRRTGLSIFYGSFTTAVITIVIVIAFNINLFSARPVLTNLRPDSKVLNSALAGVLSTNFDSFANYIKHTLSKKIFYQRK